MVGTYKKHGNPIETSTYPSPIGLLRIRVSSGFIVEVDFTDSSHLYPEKVVRWSPLTERVHKQLEEYFSGKRTSFDLPLLAEGTVFQQECWRYLQTIPYGETRSYYDEAVGIGNPKGVRAVANSNHRNSISIIIPCHRVIGKDGSLTGYGGGLWRKKWLLEHESQISQKD